MAPFIRGTARDRSGTAAFNNSFGLMRIALEYVKIRPRGRIHI